MAKKKETTSLIDAFAEFKDLKDLSKETMINVLEEGFRNVLSRIYGTDRNCEVIINLERGDFELWRTRTVVDNGAVSDDNLEIALTDAQKVDAEVEVGEDLAEKIDFSAFGRRAIINLRQTIGSRILELQKDSLRSNFSARIGQLITAEVYQVWKREALLLDDEGNELILPKSEQIPGDYFRKGESVRAVIERVENDNNNPRVILSRVSGEFLLRLMELNVPEIADGLITLKAVARVPGERAKIAVESYDERIDPVGACVGVNGSRIRGIVRELRGENIDVTTYTSNTLLFIQRALSPAKVSAISLGEDDEKEAEVYVRPEEVPLAIGKNASNLKLASLLTGYKLEIFRDSEIEEEEDIYLDEFADEIDAWIIDMLKGLGYVTAKAVLRKTREELLEQTDLEEENIDLVLRVLRSEFGEDEKKQASQKTVEDENESDAIVEEAQEE